MGHLQYWKRSPSAHTAPKMRETQPWLLSVDINLAFVERPLEMANQGNIHIFPIALTLHF